jgi:hypothetical protein
MTDSLKKLAEEMRAESSGAIRFMDEWAARLDALRERLLNIDSAVCEEMASKHGASPGIIGEQIEALRSIAGEAEETE